jgi:lipopolysaccharide transport system permease protein
LHYVQTPEMTDLQGFPETLQRKPGLSPVQHVKELLQYWELVYRFTTRELKVRYKNSVLGFFWTLLNPLGMMLVFTFVFMVLMPNNTIPHYPIFLLCGLLPWNYFSAAVMGSTNSVLSNGYLVKKVYFPREVLPLATVLANLVNFALALLVLFAFLVVSQTKLSPWIWTLPIVMLIETCFILGLGLILSALQVFYSDTLMTMEIIILAWFFLTPVFYPSTMLPRSVEILNFTVDVYRLMFILNPMASIVNMYRDILYLGYHTNALFLLRTAATAVVVLMAGYWFFQRCSDRFSEKV